MKRKVICFLAIMSSFCAMSCGRAQVSAPNAVAVFVPGVVSGSPIYEMLVSGVKKAVDAVPGVELKIIEAGFNQAEWPDKLATVAASGKFRLIVSSNPAMPELCTKVAKDYPKVRFFIADAYLKGNSSIHTVLYNQLEQGYLVGYLAGLITKFETKASSPLKVGMVVAQNYPTLDRLIQPGFEAGVKAVDPSIALEVRVVGNWFDATKAAELSRSLYDAGVRVILPIAGGAGQGTVAAAKEKNRKIVWFDGSGYALGPEVVGCAILRQDLLVEERVKAILRGDTSLYGKADIVGAKDGYVDFDPEGAGYQALPDTIRSLVTAAIDDLKNGKPSFPLESF